MQIRLNIIITSNLKNHATQSLEIYEATNQNHIYYVFSVYIGCFLRRYT